MLGWRSWTVGHGADILWSADGPESEKLVSGVFLVSRFSTFRKESHPSTGVSDRSQSRLELIAFCVDNTIIHRSASKDSERHYLTVFRSTLIPWQCHKF